MDDRLFNILWALVVLFGSAVVGYLFRETRNLWKAIRAGDARTEEQISDLAKATNESISALHEKANEIRKEMAEAVLDGERNHASKGDLAKTEKYLGDAINNLSAAISNLNDRLDRQNHR